MPYGPRWFPKVRDSIKQTVKAEKYDFDIAKDIAKPGGIMLQVWNSIRSAQVVVADLTGLNANVLYEVGIAHSLGKEVILITQNPKKLPFDVKGMRWIGYKLANVRELKKQLGQSLADVAKELALPKPNVH
jgi:predicted nucleotide-binding protein